MKRERVSALQKVEAVRESVRYRDEPGYRVLDPRKEGVRWLHVCSCRKGRSRSSPPAMHVHPGVVELCYCVRGTLAFETPEGVYPFLPGCVFTSQETEPHRMTENPRGLFVYRVLVQLPEEGKSFDGMDDADSAWLAGRIRNLPRRFFAAGQNVKTAFDRFFAAYDVRQQPPERRRIELRRLALDILLAFVDAAGRDLRMPRCPQMLEWARKMELDPARDYPIDEMRRSVQLSPSVFVQRFKEANGLPPQAYLRRCRIKLGAKMLDDGASVLNVALALKFRSAQYFATVFKSEMGVSPREWRKRLK